MQSHNGEEARIHLTNYREIFAPDRESRLESIADHIVSGYKVPDKVIAYLHAPTPFVCAPGIYPHPFRSDKTLSGPCLCTDGTYLWEKQTWKYVCKYGLVLPQKFIDHVMSEAGTAFIEQCIDDRQQWSEAVKQIKKKQGYLCFFPEKSELDTLEDF